MEMASVFAKIETENHFASRGEIIESPIKNVQDQIPMKYYNKYYFFKEILFCNQILKHCWQ